MEFDILRAAAGRHTAKAYDPNRRLSAAQIDAVRDLLRLSPSSVNLQPWRFILAGSDEGKARVAKAAEAAGTTAHGFILEAIAEKAEQAERRADFHAEAERRWAEFLDTGESIPWEDMRRYLTGRIQGKDMPRPVPRKFAK